MALLVVEAVALRSFFGIVAAIVSVALVSLAVGRILARHIFFGILPLMLSLSTVTLLSFVDTDIQKNIFMLISAGLVYVTTLGAYRLSRNPRDAIARGLMVAGATAAVFFFYAAVFGIYINYVVPLWVLALVVFSVTALVCWQYFVTIANGLFVQTIVYSLGIALVLAQTAVVTAFWPFGYLTIAATLLAVYYVLWDLAQSFFLDRLSKTRLIVNLGLSFSLAALVLSTSQWLPI